MNMFESRKPRFSPSCCDSIARRLLAFVSLCGLLAAPVRTSADEAPGLETQVKAAFLLKLAAFVEWPATTNADSPREFTIGILGDDPFGNCLKEVACDQQIRGLPVRLLRGKEVAEMLDCNILFVSPSETNRFDQVIEAVGERPILTISDEHDFARSGGVMNFIIKEDGKVRFEVNLAAAGRAHLRLSAKLLQVANIVKAAPELTAR